MTEQHTEPSQALAAPQVGFMSDDEMRRGFRLAEALFLSDAYKDIRKPEAAFAKMIIGRDLGLSPAQSMAGIHLVDGGIQMHYAMLGQFIRSRQGYDYRPGWLKLARKANVEFEGGAVDVDVVREGEDGTAFVRLPDGEVAGVIGRPLWDEEVVVWHAEEDPADNRAIWGAVIEFTVNGERRGLSRFTEADARAARLIKDDKPSAAWNTSRRNMLLARAMSNGVKWFVPEVLNGMPVYVEGELDARRKPELTAGTGDDDDAGTGVDLGPKVEALIARAEKLGHRGLSNRAAVELAVGQRAPSVVKDWEKRAKEELDRFEAQKAEAEAPEEEQVEEEVSGHVEPEDDPQERVRTTVEAEGHEVQE